MISWLVVAQTFAQNTTPGTTANQTVGQSAVQYQFVNGRYVPVAQPAPTTQNTIPRNTAQPTVAMQQGQVQMQPAYAAQPQTNSAQYPQQQYRQPYNQQQFVALQQPINSQQGYAAAPQQGVVQQQQYANPQQYVAQQQYQGQPPVVQQYQQPMQNQIYAQGQPQTNYAAAPATQAYAAPAAPSITPIAPALTGAAARNPNHPLVPIIEWAKAERPRVQAIRDYTFTLIKQESVNGKTYDPCMFDMKIRNEPFSVYLKYRQPEKKAGTEALFVKGKNNDKIQAKGVGALAIIGTTSLAPTGKFAMDGNKYPITEVGIARLVDLFIEVGENDILNNYECKVQYYENVPPMPGSSRICTCIEVIHPKVTPGKFPFHIARIFIDDELQLPIKYESYDWPKSEGEKPMLLEAYYYHDLKMNTGLTDIDFDTKNPDYRF